MKITRKFSTVLIFLLILSVLTMPLVLVLFMYGGSMQVKQLANPPRLREASEDNERPSRVMLQNVRESVVVSGTFVGSDSAFQELAYKNPEDIRWIVSVGREVCAGQVLGYYLDEEILAQYTGILKERNLYAQKPYLRYELFSAVELQCRISREDVRKLETAESLSADSLNIQLTHVSGVCNEDGTVNVRFSLPGSIFTYGQQLENLKIYTGLELKYQMVLPVSCIYQKTEGEDQPWYVYQVTQQGEPIGEIQVELGYTDGEIVCINQLEMATYYRKVN